MLKPIYALFGLTLLVALNEDSGGQSRREAPNSPPPNHTIQSQQTPAPDQRGTEQSPFIVKILPGPQSEQQTATNPKDKTNESSSEERLANFTKGLFYATLALAGIALLQLFVFGWQGIQLRRTVDAVVRSERAFVKMSHPPPGIRPEANTGLFWFEIEIKNFGRTPATVSDVLLNRLVLPKGDVLPAIPPYERQSGSIPRAFLAADEGMFYRRVYQITPEEMIAVKDHQSDLYLIGYVDYTDQFKKRHRAGYARVYRPAIDDRASYRTDAEFEARNNLAFVTQAGYNYDCPRRRWERDGRGLSKVVIESSPG
jgi:hypothetical protein